MNVEVSERANENGSFYMKWVKIREKDEDEEKNM